MEVFCHGECGSARTRHCRIGTIALSSMVLLLLSLVRPSETLFLSHHPRRTPSASASNRSGGPSTSATPPLEPNTRRRRRESSSASPLIVFYGSLVDRVRRSSPEGSEKASNHENGNGSSDGHRREPPAPGDEKLFTEDMRQRKQEFVRRIEHYRGRGRWGGYSFQGMAQSSAPRAAPLDVVSTQAKDSDHRNQQQQQQQQKQKQQQGNQQINEEFLLEYYRGRGRWGGYAMRGIPQTKPSPAAAAATLRAVEQPSSAPVTKTGNRSKTRSNQGTRIRKLARKDSMLQIKDIQHYKEEVVDAKDASLVVVRFYASWCKACKAIESSFHRLPQEFPSTVKFVEVPLTKENAYLHKGLGVSSLPFAHIYYNADHPDNGGPERRGEGDESSSMASAANSCTLVDELKISRNEFSNFRRVLRSYVDKECTVYFSANENDETVVSSTPSRPGKLGGGSRGDGNKKIAEGESETAIPI